jgi:hypothetical protein
MQLAPDTILPAYDQAQLDKRFLVELDRLLEAEAFATYHEWANAVGVNRNYVAAIARGTYHANLMLLYNTVRHFPSFDFAYVVFGAAVTDRAEPLTLPARRSGPRPKTALPA